MRCVSPRSRLKQAAGAAEVRPSRPSASGLSAFTAPLRHMRGQRRAESFGRWESWFGRERRRLELAQPQGSGLHKKSGFSLRQAAHGWLVVLRQKTRRLFLLNLLTQYGHLGSILAIATIKR